VLPLVDPADYARVLESLRAGEVPLAERRRLAAKAFQHVALYDTAIAAYLRDNDAAGAGEGDVSLPDQLTVGMNRLSELRREPAPAGCLLRPGYAGRGPGWPGSR